MNIETKGLGAGSYPDAPEEKGGWYAVTVAVSTYATVYVCAESAEEAERLAMQGDYEDIEIEKNGCVFEEVEDVEKTS